MPIPIEKEPFYGWADFGKERCCFCRKRTPWWTKLPERKEGQQVACCQDCAETHKPSEVPTKSAWFKAEAGHAEREA